MNQVDQKIYVLPAIELNQLIEALQKRGYQVFGPKVKDQVIKYEAITSVKDLPKLIDKQTPGSYQLEETKDKRLFGFTVGPDSLKKFLHPIRVSLYRVQKTKTGLQISNQNQALEKSAFFSVRSCDLKAMQIQDTVLLGQNFQDSIYQANREKNLFIALNCATPADTCFCVSMNSGPRVEKNTPYDLCLTEIVKADTHHFLIEVGSKTGLEIIRELKLKQVEATLGEEQIENLASDCASQMKRSMNQEGIAALFSNNENSHQWAEVAERCLACANCTMVCPTCFCTTTEDLNHLNGDAERVRRHDSCFNADFSYIHGGSVRGSTASRYRQFISHKLGTWHAQFGSSGCVGCGRCITWCPPGIDITEEVRKMREV